MVDILLDDTPSSLPVKQSSFSPIFLHFLKRRGFDSPQKIENFLNTSLARLENPFAMKGMKEAVDLICKTVAGCQKILIHGDYDVDGITGSALMARTLTELKADFEVFLPDRSRDGYGVSANAIRDAASRGVKLLVTVDCGITAAEKIKEARSLGLEVIVIDHHRIPNEGLPPAAVILNPQQRDCAYPFKELSAAGLVFKLSQALIGDDAFRFLDLAALSTVCDVAPLIGENRILVKKGLEILSQRKTPAIRFMAQEAGIKSREMNVGHIGFMLGPRINAAGRMSSPEIALRLLMTDNLKEAESLARVLEEENKLRQKEERQVVKEAIDEVERTINFNRDRVIVVGRQGWHPGVIGIVASRLVDKYHRPAIVIAFDNTTGKGSGRSIKNFHLFNALDYCRDLFVEFGGHEQAAGLTIQAQNLAAFRSRINEYAKGLSSEIFRHHVQADLELNLEDFRTSFLEELKLLEPHGAGNPRPVFLTRKVTIKNKPERLYGGETLKFWVTDGIFTYEALWKENPAANFLSPAKGMKVDLVFTVKTKIWDGIENLVLEVKEIRQPL